MLLRHSNMPTVRTKRCSRRVAAHFRQGKKFLYVLYLSGKIKCSTLHECEFSAKLLKT